MFILRFLVIVCTLHSQDWEIFQQIPCGPNMFYFRSHHGKYLSAQADGRLECNRQQAQQWEAFTLEFVGGQPQMMGMFL